MPYLDAARLSASRYIKAWMWLGRYIAHERILIFLSTIFLAICGRLGTIIGFVATVQSVVFIIALPKIPNFVTQIGIDNPDTFSTILVAFPALIFLIVAVTQNLFERYASSLKAKVSVDLATQKIQFLTSVNNHSDIPGPTSPVIVAEYQKRYLSVFRIMTSFINCLVFGSVFTLTVAVGVIINPLVIGATIFIAVSLGGVFLIMRHKESLSYEAGGAQRADEIIQSKNSFLEYLNKTENNNLGIKAIRNASQPFNLATERGQKSKESVLIQSKLIMDMIQAFVILFFLFLIVGESVDTAKVGTLALLVLIIRFSVTYFQGLIKTILSLSKDYPLVVAMRLEQINLAKPDTSIKKQTMTNKIP